MKKFFQRVFAFFARNPARLFGLISAVVALAASFGLHLSKDQIGTIMALIGLVAGETTRTLVWPKSLLQPTKPVAGS